MASPQPTYEPYLQLAEGREDVVYEQEMAAGTVTLAANPAITPDLWLVPPISEAVANSESHDTITACGAARVGRTAVKYTVHGVNNIGNSPVDIFVPGFAETMAAYNDLAGHVQMKGGAAITFEALRTSGEGVLNPQQYLQPATLTCQSLVAIMRDVQDIHGIRRFRLKGHSNGAPPIVTVAEETATSSSELQVESITLIDPASVIDPRLLYSPLRGPRLLGEVTRVAARHPGLGIEWLGYLAKNPARSGCEMFSSNFLHITAVRLRRLQKLGIGTAALVHRMDPVFPGKKIEDKIGNAVHEFKYGENGGHLAPLTHPAEVADELAVIDAKLHNIRARQ